MVLDNSGSLPWHKKKQWISPTISKLKDDILNSDTSSIAKFWERLEKEGAPIIEPINGNETHELVTFVVRAEDDTRNAVIICALFDQDDIISHNICERIENTDVFYKSVVVLNGTRAIYTISKNNSLRYKHFYDNLMRNWDTLGKVIVVGEECFEAFDRSKCCPHKLMIY